MRRGPPRPRARPLGKEGTRAAAEPRRILGLGALEQAPGQTPNAAGCWGGCRALLPPDTAPSTHRPLTVFPVFLKEVDFISFFSFFFPSFLFNYYFLFYLGVVSFVLSRLPSPPLPEAVGEGSLALPSLPAGVWMCVRVSVDVLRGGGGNHTVLQKGDCPGPEQAPTGVSCPNRLEVEGRNPQTCV